MKPTSELYDAMQVAFDHFNLNLFNNKLPQVIFTIHRQHGVMGYFAPSRWASADGKRCHEIAINPLYVGKAVLIELMQTLVHEMTHCWQEDHGKPSNRTYHNKQWANKMISLGLMPSDTGSPGGAITGQHMSDYPLPNGKFIKVCESLLKHKKFNLPWVDRLSHTRTSDDERLHNIKEVLGDTDSDLLTQLTTPLSELFSPESFVIREEAAAKKVKVKYTCPGCKINVWGKTGLSICCEECDESLLVS